MSDKKKTLEKAQATFKTVLGQIATEATDARLGERPDELGRYSTAHGIEKHTAELIRALLSRPESPLTLKPEELEARYETVNAFLYAAMGNLSSLPEEVFGRIEVQMADELGPGITFPTAFELQVDAQVSYLCQAGQTSEQARGYLNKKIQEYRNSHNGKNPDSNVLVQLSASLADPTALAALRNKEPNS